jgi:hypothetical protein
MAITVDDFTDMELEFTRAIRTESSEEYLIFSSDPEAGSELAGSSNHGSRVGRFILQYADGPLSRPFVSANLILEAKWEDSAISEIVDELDRKIVDSLGSGARHQRSTIDVVTFEGEVVGGTTDQIKSDKERGLHGIHNQLQKTQEMIESIPDTLDEVLNDQYEEIEEIIESQELDDEEKRQRVRDKLRVGLERGLPTIVYEGSSERE